MATLTITLTESLSLGDGATDRGTTNIQTVNGINEVDHRIMDVQTSYTNIIRFGSAAGAGTFEDGAVKYLRITNLDSTNYVTLRVQQSDAEYFVKLSPEDHFILGDNMMDAHEDGDTALGTADSLANIDVISAKANSAICQIEYFIASVD
tara:strand:+ start:309 stop:758 length:450 start_codon:yes stop_codon:yes gene_type:complete